ncbi:T cell activation RhoGTPase activating protein b [Halichoeres trimaculatus]|uniref:T cell activation RhoGTPase activating protein b n=1 Tax=Halichoeres trimaculatus TaxID=147232 RepID=UPI003D9F8DE3
MDTPDNGIVAMRRGSYDDAAASLRPHLRHLAQRRRSAPSLVFAKALGMPWSPIREEASCRVSVDQSPFVLGLISENGELLLDDCVQVTEGSKTKERHVFLFRDVIVFAKLKSTASYRLKHRVSLEDIWLHGFEDEPEVETGTRGEVDLRVTIILAWAFNCFLVCFRSPEVKERWLDTLHRKIEHAKATVGCASPPPEVLMKVLSGSITTKTLTGGGMEQFIECPLDGDENIAQLNQLHNQEEKPAQPIETKWKLVRKLAKGTSFSSRTRRSETDTKTQLFGQPLIKISPDGCSLPKPVTEMLLLLRKRGPSTEGVFRKSGNSKNMKEIREKLNSGLEVDLEGQAVFLLAGLLKSFLRELPGSLLVSDLYADWVVALDTEDTQQRATEINQVVDKLPALNKLLLQHLTCVLHHIHQSADINKMDAYNLAVCIAPTLLLLDGSQDELRLKKVTELTQFLIESCEILGENIPNLLDTDEDSLSSQHHDSAYDSTDPDGDGEMGESACSTHEGSGSSSSLSPSLSASTSSWPANSSFDTKSPFNRRCSEPTILLSADLESVCGHARSHDDCSMKRRGFDDQPLKKPISDDSFLLRGQGGARQVLMFPKLSSSSNMDPLPYMAGKHAQNCSCSSLESAASNQSDSSVFTSSPLGSPASHRRANNSTQSLVAVKAHQDIPHPISDEKKRSQSMRVTTKALLRTRSLGAFTRSSLKKDSQKDLSFPCETLQEDSQSEADQPAELLRKPRPLSAIEVFKQVDKGLPSRPPSYEHAVLSAGLPPQYRSMTVHDAIQLERRSRPSSVSYDFPPTWTAHQYSNCLAQADAVEQRPFRQRAMSESVSARHHEVVTRRCSQPVFEEFSYAKESYV